MKAWELLSAPGAWCQGAMARDQSGDGVPIGSNAACRWCALGALTRCYGARGLDAFLHAIDALRAHEQVRALGGVNLWNDRRGRTQEEVVALLKELDL